MSYFIDRLKASLTGMIIYALSYSDHCGWTKYAFLK